MFVFSSIVSNIPQQGTTFHLPCFPTPPPPAPSPIKAIPRFELDDVVIPPGTRQNVQKVLQRRNKHLHKYTPIMKEVGMIGEKLYKVYTANFHGQEYSMVSHDRPCVLSNVWGLEFGLNDIWEKNDEYETTRKAMLLLLGHDESSCTDGEVVYNWQQEYQDKIQSLEARKQEIEYQRFGTLESKGIFAKFKNSATANTSISTEAPSHKAPNGFILFGPNSLAKDFIRRASLGYSESARGVFLDLINASEEDEEKENTKKKRRRERNEKTKSKKETDEER